MITSGVALDSEMLQPLAPPPGHNARLAGVKTGAAARTRCNPETTTSDGSRPGLYARTETFVVTKTRSCRRYTSSVDVLLGADPFVE